MSKRKRGAETAGAGSIPTDVTFDPFTDMFREDGWVNSNALDERTCMHYFSLATAHYSTGSLNHQVNYGGLAEAEAERRGGTWYQCERLRAGMNPRFPLVVVKETQRHAQKSRDEDSLRAMYYMLEGNILRSPPLHNVLRARLLKAAQHIDNAFAMLQGKRAFNLVEGFGWETEDGADSSDRSSPPSSGDKKRSTATNQAAHKTTKRIKGPPLKQSRKGK